MTDAARLRDSTEIRLLSPALVGLRAELEERFVVAVRADGGGIQCRQSNRQKHASEFLARSGVALG
jgi:hypothetical protein